MLDALPKIGPFGDQLLQPGIAIQFRLPGVGVVGQRFEKVAVDVDPAVEVAKERFGFLEEGIGEGRTTNMHQRFDRLAPVDDFKALQQLGAGSPPHLHGQFAASRVAQQPLLVDRQIFGDLHLHAKSHRIGSGEVEVHLGPAVGGDLWLVSPLPGDAAEAHPLQVMGQ